MIGASWRATRHAAAHLLERHMVEELVERDRREERVVGEALAAPRSRRAAGGSQRVGVSITSPRVSFGCSIATIASPARKCAARSAGEPVALEQVLEPVVGLHGGELPAVAGSRA